MDYIIKHTNGDEITIGEGEINNQTSIVMTGKTTINALYYINTDLMQMLENFANSDAPANPITGQLWYDNTEKALKLYHKEWTSFGTVKPDLKNYVQTYDDVMTGPLAVNPPYSSNSIVTRSYIERYAFTPEIKSDTNYNYIKYSNKYTIINYVAKNTTEVVLPVTMKDTSYSVLMTCSTTRSSGPETTHYSVYKKTKTGFSFANNETYETTDFIIMGFAE